MFTQDLCQQQDLAGRPQADAIALRAVAKSYDGRTNVVEALDLVVRAGEFLTILGPSGSGKTSILMMLAGFEQPTAGAIYMGGRDVSRLPPHKRDIGMVFQHYALFPHLPVSENLAYPLRARRWSGPRIAERVGWALSLVRLEALADRRPAQLSGGQQQRIALARALIYAPRLVLMDEPLGALDKQLRDQMQDELVRIHRQLRPTIVYVTHDQAEALGLSDRVAVFEGGRIAQIGTPSELYEAPETPFVAGFIGENNRIAATLVGPQASHWLLQLATGELVTAQAIGAAHVGQPASIVVRPERVKRAAGDAPNRVTAEVLDTAYLGESFRVRCRVGGTSEIIWRLPNCGEDPPPLPGETVRLGWRPQDARAFPLTP